MRLPATIAAAVIAAAAVATVGACGAHGTVNRAAESRWARCVDQYGLEICADLSNNPHSTAAP